MKLSYFLDYVNSGRPVENNSDIHKMFHKLSREALKITSKINNRYNSPEKIRKLFSKLTGTNIDSTFTLFPPFYTDCGKNIKIGKNVFINACCKFQDQGGIVIGDGALIGHNVTIATINHNFNPKDRGSMSLLPVTIMENVWIGSDSTILPGVTIGSGAIIGAGSVATKDVPNNTIYAGNPARFIKNVNQ